jgi:RNA polymerase sigma factor (sigma-70 family)
MSLREARKVTDDDYRNALANHDNKRIMGKVLSGYAGKLPPELLQDCMQDALLYTLANHDYEDPSGKKFTSSLHQILHFYLRKALRRNRGFNRRHALARERELRRHQEYYSGKNDEEDLRITVLPLLAELRENYRLVLSLYYLDGLTFQQIADQLGWHLVQVKTVHNNALAVCAKLGPVKVSMGTCPEFSEVQYG